MGLCRQGLLRVQVLEMEVRTPLGCTEVRVDNDFSLHLIPAGWRCLLLPIALVRAQNTKIR
jgi:hypothetical protein